ncbi:MAG: hypothetical protein NXY57DRAFT_973567 [Lentinula lateritia]|nr:MAG: hypothetical protein NXY57DRAFT_973567 [Lentinula lateritia]
MTSPDLPDTPRIVLYRPSVISRTQNRLREECDVLPVVEDSSVEKAHQKLRERGILIDERWREINFRVGEQEQEQETKVEVEVDARAQCSSCLSK